MELEGKRIGYALTGSFCTLSKIMPELKKLKESGAEIYPIISEAVWSTDTRFATSKSIKDQVTDICKREIIHTIVGAEPIGPKKLLDALIIAPCTGNTLSKIALGITDTCVSMAAKANLRNNRPLVIGISTNDGMGANGKNLGILLNCVNVYFVPFGQDDPTNKPTSLVADMNATVETLKLALDGKQIQPLLKMRTQGSM